MPASSANFAAALRHRHFRNLWLGQVVANIGNYFYFLALLISVNQLTGSTLAMSLMTISFALPQLIFGMAAGVYVDRWDRRRVMILSDVLRGALVLLCLLVRDPQQVWIYYVVGFAHGVLGSFFNPARDAVIPNLVEPDELLAANSLTQATQSASMLLGPAAAGFLIDAYGIAPAFVINAGTFLASALAILTIPSQRATRDAPAAGLSAVWREIRDVRLLTRGRALWRFSLAPTDGAELVPWYRELGAEWLLDWAGGLVWLAPPEAYAYRADELRRALDGRDGHATLVRAPEDVRARVEVFQPQPPALRALTERVKRGFDPQMILNRGRMYAGM